MKTVYKKEEYEKLYNVQMKMGTGFITKMLDKYFRYDDELLEKSRDNKTYIYFRKKLRLYMRRHFRTVREYHAINKKYLEARKEVFELRKKVRTYENLR